MSIKFIADPHKARMDQQRAYTGYLSGIVEGLASGTLKAPKAKRGRKPDPNAKKLLTLRLDPQVIEHFRATGKGWQTRINDALRKAAGL